MTGYMLSLIDYRDPKKQERGVLLTLGNLSSIFPTLKKITFPSKYFRNWLSLADADISL